MGIADRISLAELARLPTGTGEPMEGLAGVGGFSDAHISLETPPTLADISECLFFSPGDGRIWLQNQRMVLLHTDALGSLRREMIDSLGVDRVRGLFTRAGYVSGARDAALVRKQWPDADPPAAAIAGTRLHALEGMVKVEVVQASYDPQTGGYQGEFLWHHSSEDDEHLAAYGIGGSPACWMQVGYATGYVSALFGRLIVFREVECRSMGASHCRVIGKTADLWEDLEDDMRYLNARDFVDTAAYERERALPKAARLQADASSPAQAMVGASSAFNAACHQLNRVARTCATVLFTGESGVGKEKFAQMLHRISPRKEMPFVAVNCAAIPDTLIEAELFGVERGAYTGASHSRAGRFERAHGGTLFLDEIATLSFVAQGKLLRALQEGEVERVGGSHAVRVDVRVVAATNESLRQAVQEGRFREDLFFRLHVFPIHLPPLRDRRDDIPLLMNHFLNHYRQKHGCLARGFTQAAVRSLLNYDFPGNIRELQNLIERAVILADGTDMIDLHHIFTGGEVQKGNVLTLQANGSLSRVESEVGAVRGDDSSWTRGAGAPAWPSKGRTLDHAEKSMLKDALIACGGNYSAAARMLNITRAKMIYRSQKHGLRFGQENAAEGGAESHGR